MTEREFTDYLARMLESESLAPCRYSLDLIPRWQQVAWRLEAFFWDDQSRQIASACAQAYLGE